MSRLSLILLSTFAISLGSLIGVFTLSLKPKKLEKILLYLVSLSAGAMMGAAFLHLLPESPDYLLTLFSFIGFFVIEKFLYWRHCHHQNCPEHIFGYMNLIGDSLHNFLDGLIIAATFTNNNSLGLVAVLAIALHEIPQEIGDFGVLLYSGWSRRQALLANFLVALTAVAGGLIGYWLSDIQQFSTSLMPIATGGFIYIAASDLLPEIRKETNLKKSLLLLVIFLIGVLMMNVIK